MFNASIPRNAPGAKAIAKVDLQTSFFMDRMDATTSPIIIRGLVHLPEPEEPEKEPETAVAEDRTEEAELEKTTPKKKKRSKEEKQRDRKKEKKQKRALEEGSEETTPKTPSSQPPPKQKRKVESTHSP